ncbi:MAG: rhodanese-like domain-containing protein [Pyrinomonadaceae bacterium]
MPNQFHHSRRIEGKTFKERGRNDHRCAVRQWNRLIKIKGAVYVKLRRLKYRLAFPPLKDVPRNRDVVTYCACPNDEASIRAAQVLRESGFTRVHVLKGGWVVWKKANGQIERTARGL